MRNFYDWLNKRKVFVEVFGSSWNYEVPEDKEQQLYDFYMLESLLPPGIKMYLRAVDLGPDQAGPDEYGDARTQEDKVYYALYEVAGKLLPALKKNLLNAVMFSIMAEMRHALDFYNKSNEYDYDDADEDESISREDKLKRFMSGIEKELGSEYSTLFKSYIKRYSLYKGDASPLMRRVSINNPDFKTKHNSRKASYRAMLKSGGSPEQWVTLAHWIFSHGYWASSFGGEAWANIAEAWLKLNQAQGASHIMSWIDRIYDLQHNTDTVFNKVQGYMKDGSYDWLRQALDKKRDIKSPYEIIDDVSPPMRKLAQKAMWVLNRVSRQEFEQERDKEKAKKDHERYAYKIEPEEEDTASQDLEIANYIQNSPLNAYSLPQSVLVARLALKLPFMHSGGYTEKVKKINEVLKIDSNHEMMEQAIAQCDIEESNNSYFNNTEKSTWSFDLKYYTKEEAEDALNKIFKSVPGVYLPESQLHLMLTLFHTHDTNKMKQCIRIVKDMTNYDIEAAKTLTLYLLLRAIAYGHLGDEYHTQGQQIEFSKLKQSLLPTWNGMSGLPIELRIARMLNIANQHKEKGAEISLETIAKALNLSPNPQQLQAVQKLALEEKQKELYFSYNVAFNANYTRQQAYEIIEKHFKTAPLVKLDPAKEKQLEAFIMNKMQKIQAIKLFREMTGWGLKASKNYVEYLILEMIYLGANPV